VLSVIQASERIMQDRDGGRLLTEILPLVYMPRV